MMQYLLRKATKKDAARINDLYVEMLKTIYGKENVEGYNDGAIDYYFSSGEDWICVAEVGGIIAAFLSIEVHREQNGFLYYDDFSVSADYRGMGIGTALMLEAEKYCKSIGFTTITLHVEKTNLSAQKFYKNRGFIILREEESRLHLIKHLA